MVKRYELDDFDPIISVCNEGDYVLYSDYEEVLKALEEALLAWEWLSGKWLTEDGTNPRISLLRSQYLKG